MLSHANMDSEERKEYSRSVISHPSFRPLRTRLGTLVLAVVAAAVLSVLVVLRRAPDESRKELVFFLGAPCFFLLIIGIATLMHLNDEIVFMLMMITGFLASLILGYTYEFILTGIMFPLIEG